ncbi:coiled-coil domain-containing protein [Natronoglycomyces albus]|uniref:Uncharacterized protein n=1 Tax=Natronoglycomyces albus TaxID=2811108 RepID=A0A895XXD9_9ACTN|nr:hypothetical protein [Natronoglycomyces albus]QSB07176.1 hypothetical protein JQS30_17185 [Natronoglycomyces albus]
MPELFEGGPPTVDEFSAWWDVYGYLIETSLGAAVLVILMITLIVAKIRGRIDSWIANTVTLMVLVYQSHGVWGLLGRAFDMPFGLKICLFFVIEGLVLFFAAKALKRLEATIEYGEPDEDGNRKVLANGRTGWPGIAVWIIAISTGILVGLSEEAPYAFWFRFGIGVAAAALWWANLTEDRIALDVKRSKKNTRWRWTPERLMVNWGWLEPDDGDVEDTNEEWLKRKLVKLAHVHHTSRLPWRRALAGKRLVSWSQSATDEVLDAVRNQLVLMYLVRERTNPDAAVQDAIEAAQQGRSEEIKTLTATHENELESVRAAAKEQLVTAEQRIKELEELHSSTIESFRNQVEALKSDAGEQIRQLQEEVGRLRPDAERAEALAHKINQIRNSNASGGPKTPAPASGASSTASMGSPVVTERPSSAPPAPVRTPTQRAGLDPNQAPPSAGNAALAVKPTMTGKEQLRATWDVLASEGKVSGETSTATLVELGLTVVSAEVSRDSARRYASEWAREQRKNAAAAASASQGPRLRRIETTPRSD